MRKTVLALATVAAVSLAVTAPAEAHWRHRGFVGPGLAFGLMAGAIAAAAAPRYYYGPGYYDPYYYPSYYRSYGYYGGPGVVVAPRYYGYRRWHHW